MGKALDGASHRTKLKQVTPHVLKHTAINLEIQVAMTMEEASEYFGTSVATIRGSHVPSGAPPQISQ